MHQILLHYYRHFFVPFRAGVEGKEVDDGLTVVVVLLPCNFVEVRIFLIKGDRILYFLPHHSSPCQLQNWHSEIQKFYSPFSPAGVRVRNVFHFKLKTV